MKKEELSEGVTLYCGDCREILAALPRHGACVTDPPYGQDHKVNTFFAGGTRERAIVQRNGKHLPVRPKIYEPIVGDKEPFDPAHLLDIAPHLLIWGAHKFADRLPPGGWLVWDKVPTGKVRDQGDGEAAWINDDRPMRIFRLLWDGLCVGTGARHEVTAGQQRLHPAQKPELLMDWCLQQLPASVASVIDPYMGSGSTGVAAVRRGLAFTGIESVEEYYDISRARIERELRQPKLFQEPKQSALRQQPLGI